MVDYSGPHIILALSVALAVYTFYNINQHD